VLRLLQAGVPNYFESSKGRFVYLRIPVYDASTSVSEILLAADDIVSFIAKGLLHGSVFVHCQRGVSRSTTAVMLYLMRYVVSVGMHC
jgi:protein-tyrosine phosphatase